MNLGQNGRTKFWNRKRPHVKKGAGFLKYVGPGLLVTVGFIDPGNWASNIAAGSQYGYSLLWMVTLSTIMLIVLQHNAAHLGIVTGKCLSEAATEHMRPWIKNVVLITAVGAAVSTALAEILGTAIALNMLTGLPIKLGALLTLAVVLFLQFTNSYKKIETIIIGFVSLIGLSFRFEIAIVNTDWGAAASGWVTPAFPNGAMLVIMSVLGAVVMPHNLFLHSEIIQSRQWNLEDDAVIKKQLKYEFGDTLLSMLIGWAINSAMILMAAATFFTSHTVVTDLAQAEAMLKPCWATRRAWCSRSRCCSRGFPPASRRAWRAAVFSPVSSPSPTTSRTAIPAPACWSPWYPRR
jgi:manganese transport protein